MSLVWAEVHICEGYLAMMTKFPARIRALLCPQALKRRLEQYSLSSTIMFSYYIAICPLQLLIIPPVFLFSLIEISCKSG